MLRREKILFCSLQGLESRTVRKEQLQGKRVSFQGKKIWRGAADKKGSVSGRDGQPLGLGSADTVI